MRLTEMRSNLLFRSNGEGQSTGLPSPARWCADFSPARSFARGFIAAGLILQSKLALAQEALRTSMATQTAAEAHGAQTEDQPYTFKSGDFSVLMAPSMDFQWNDNVTLQENGAESDFILTPAVGLDASYALSQRNVLQVDVTAGYNEYLDHPELSKFYLASGSQLALNVYVSDFLFNFHDDISYFQDAATEPAVSGTGSYGTFENTAGLSGTWNLGDVTSTLGYDHQNVLATSSQFNYTDQASELLLGRTGLKVYPDVTLGVEATGSFTTYTYQTLNDNSSCSVGVYAQWIPGTYLSVEPRFGYTTYFFQQTSTSVAASDVSTWYADLTINHQATEFLTYSFSVGHELRLGIESDLVEDTYVRPNLTWKIIKDVSIGTAFSYENGTQAGGVVGNAFGENYNYYSVDLGLTCTPIERVSASLYYRLVDRMSDVATAGYTQNVVGITLKYVLP